MPSHGWEFRVKRMGLHKRMHQVRTYGSYEVFLDGKSAAGTNPLLKGNVCAGTYPLTTQFGNYVSIGFSTDTHIAAKPQTIGPGKNHPAGNGLRIEARRTQRNSDPPRPSKKRGRRSAGGLCVKHRLLQFDAPADAAAGRHQFL